MKYLIKDVNKYLSDYSKKLGRNNNENTLCFI
jgi:hypothetical protein